MSKWTLPVDYTKLKPVERWEVRLQYVKEQNGKCMWCEHDLNGNPSVSVQSKKQKINWELFPPYFLKHPVHLQHNHETGMTEGAVHALCNAVMWQYHGR